MIESLLLHPRTRQTVLQLIDSHAHAVLISGSLGSGKETLAISIAHAHLEMQNLENAPYFKSIYPDGKTISIEQIRELQKFLQLKTTGTKQIRRIAILHTADTMSIEAQNALLKILEEPPADTLIILTAQKSQNLKPTIHSRVQNVRVLPPTQQDCDDFFKAKKFQPSDITRAYMLSNGNVGLLSSLLEGDNTHPLIAYIAKAKEIYGLPLYEKLLKVEQLSKDKDSLPGFLYACRRICTSALEQAALRNDVRAAEVWHKQLELVSSTESRLPANPNAKLLLTHFFMHM